MTQQTIIQKKYNEFMNKHKVHTKKDEKGKVIPQEITHTKIGSTELNIYGASYFIAPEELATFYDLYENYVFEENNYEYLTEKQT